MNATGKKSRKIAVSKKAIEVVFVQQTNYCKSIFPVA